MNGAKNKPRVKPKGRLHQVFLAIEEKRLIEHLRELEWGQVVVEAKNGVPVLVKQTRQDIKLTD